MDDAQDRVLTGDVGSIVKILNQHQNSLADLESTGRRMEEELGQVSRLLAQR
jgi:hypothetical protein